MTISIEEMKRDINGYLQRVKAGETIVVTDADRPIAEVKPVSSEVGSSELRPIGLCEGKFVVPDDFDAPLPDGVLNEFEGK
jgi:antitoxin (DNA-binding transcriptional repressor) of toxin-antitoxin stability system